MNTIAENIKHLQSRILDYEIKYQRQPNSVSFMVASKNKSIHEMSEVVKAGVFRFGESYVQEALPKIKALTNPEIEWHFVGLVQSNKTKKISEHFSWVHSVINKKTAMRLNDQRPDQLPNLNVCITINISKEPTKSGVHLDELMDLAHYCKNLPRLNLRGLMAIPAPKKEFAEQRLELHKLKVIFDEFNANGFAFDTLTMGMTNDLEAAIAEGATMIRIARAIFGHK